MTEKEKNALADDLYWIHDLLGSAGVNDNGFEISPAAFEKATQHGILEERDGKFMLKYIGSVVEAKKG